MKPLRARELPVADGPHGGFHFPDRKHVRGLVRQIGQSHDIQLVASAVLATSHRRRPHPWLASPPRVWVLA